MSKTGLRWLWLAVLVLMVDLGSKQWVVANMALWESRSILPFFSVYYAHNSGAAFSFLADLGGGQRWFFAGVALGICAVLLVLMYRGKATEKVSNIAYALIIGGALGNLTDRLMHGVVIDFLDFHVGNLNFPIFNLADIAIAIGVLMIILAGFLTPSQPTAQDKR